jgi:hypothetical protein
VDPWQITWQLGEDPLCGADGLTVWQKSDHLNPHREADISKTQKY